MALSGSTSVTATKTTSGNVGDTLKFSWSAAQSVADNTSTVTWKLELVAGAAGYISSSVNKKWSVTVNGTQYSGTNTIGIANNATKTLASGSTAVPHNSDGTKSFSYSFSQQFSITFGGKSVGTVSGSGTATLDTIARASAFSVAAGTLGTAQTISVTRQSTSFSHTLRYVCGSASGTIVSGSTAASISWTPPLSLASQNTTGTSVTVTVYLQTYSGSAKVGGEVSKTVSMAIPASVKPSCTIAVTDVAGYASTYGGYLVGLSRMEVTVTPTTSYGAPIKSYAISANGETGAGTPYTTGAVKSSGSLPVSATVTDGRGRQGTASTTVTALDYSAPKLTIAVHRCDGDGTENLQGEYIRVDYQGSVTALGGKNTAQSLKLQYKKSAESSYTPVDLGTGTLTGMAVFPADTGSSYGVSVTLSDTLFATTKSTSASTAAALLHFGADGDRIGVGKVAERPGLDVGWDAYFGKAVHFGGEVTGLPIGGITASGSQDGWRWRVYSDGTAELYGYVSIGSVVCTSGDGGGGYYGTIPSQTFPITFKSIVYRSYGAASGGGGHTGVSAGVDGTLTATGGLFLRTAYSRTLTNVTLFVEIKGLAAG